MNHAPPLWRSRNLVPMQNSESPRRDPETTSPVASPLLGNLTLVFSTKCSGPFAAAEEVEVAPAELPAGLVSSPPQAARAIAAPPSASARDASRRGPEVLWSPRIAWRTYPPRHFHRKCDRVRPFAKLGDFGQPP